MVRKDLGTFEAIECNGLVYKAVPPTPGAKSDAARYWRVRTFTDPESLAVFAAHCVARSETAILRFADGEVTIVRQGHVQSASLPYLVGLLSDDELRLLALFGVHVGKLIQGHK